MLERKKIFFLSLLGFLAFCLVLLLIGLIMWYRQFYLEAYDFQTIIPFSARKISKDLTFTERQKYEEELSKALQEVEKNPQNVAAWFNLGIARENLGDFIGAAKAYLKSYALAPHTTSLSLDRLAFVLEKLGDYRGAEKAWLLAIKNVPSNSLLYLHLGEFYRFRYKQPKEKIVQVYEKGIAASGDPNLALELASFYESIGDSVNANFARAKANDLKNATSNLQLQTEK